MYHVFNQSEPSTLPVTLYISAGYFALPPLWLYTITICTPLKRGFEILGEYSIFSSFYVSVIRFLWLSHVLYFLGIPLFVTCANLYRVPPNILVLIFTLRIALLSNGTVFGGRTVIKTVRHDSHGIKSFKPDIVRSKCRWCILFVFSSFFFL